MARSSRCLATWESCRPTWPITTSCGRCGPRTSCLARLLAREGIRRRCHCPAAAPSARGPWTSISPGLRRWAQRLSWKDGYLHAKAPGGVDQGARVEFRFASVGATENTADGRDTWPKGDRLVIEQRRASLRSSTSPTACARWARGSRATGTSTITIEGVDRLWGRGRTRLSRTGSSLGTYMLAPVDHRRRRGTAQHGSIRPDRVPWPRRLEEGGIWKSPRNRTAVVKVDLPERPGPTGGGREDGDRIPDSRPTCRRSSWRC